MKRLAALLSVIVAGGLLAPAAAAADPYAAWRGNARAAALGGAYAALGDDASAWFWNPAALVLPERAQFDLSFDGAGAADGWGATYFATGWGAFAVGTLGLAPAGATNGARAWSLAFGRPLFRWLSLGASLDIERQVFGGADKLGFGFSAALHIHPQGLAAAAGDGSLTKFLKGALSDRLLLGATLQRAGLSFAAPYAAREANLKLGLAYRILPGALLVSLEKDLLESDNDFSFGAELTPWRGLALRAGVRAATNRTAFAVGFGWRHEDFGLDYAYDFTLKQHRAGFSARVGSTKKQRADVLYRDGLKLLAGADATIGGFQRIHEADVAFDDAYFLDPEHAQARAQRKVVEERIEAILGQELKAGQAAAARKDWPEAAKSYRKVLRLKSGHDGAEKELRAIKPQLDAWTAQRNQAGKTAWEAKRYDDAFAVFAAVLDIDPDNGTARDYRKRIIRIREGEAEGMYTKGIAAYNAGNLQAAIWWFQQALRLNPDHSSARSYYAQAEYRNTLTVYLNQGIAQYNAGNFWAAKASFEAVLGRYPGNPTAVQYLALCEKKVAAAVEQYYQQGVAAYNANNFKAAVDLLGRVLSAYPGGYQRAAQYKARAEAKLKELGNY